MPDSPKVHDKFVGALCSLTFSLENLISLGNEFPYDLFICKEAFRKLSKQKFPSHPVIQ